MPNSLLSGLLKSENYLNFVIVHFNGLWTVGPNEKAISRRLGEIMTDIFMIFDILKTNNERHCKLSHSHIHVSVILALDDTHCSCIKNIRQYQQTDLSV